MVYQNRTYLDYNATAPALDEVLFELKEGNWPMGNPSSVHTCGKKAKRKIGEARSFLYDLFSLKERDFDLYFHSGATESTNTLVKSMGLQAFKDGSQFLYLYAVSDHSCVVNQVDFLDTLNHEHQAFAIDEDGEIKIAELEAILSGVDFNESRVLLNWTWVNNETGVVNPLSHAEKLKEKFPQVFIHVDAVQAIGKIEEAYNLSGAIDAYTFSGHKFGALKGIGFSFVRQGLLHALMNGGGQQGKLRSGTENTWGIFSLKPALEVMKERYSFTAQNEGKLYIENQLTALIGDKGHIAGAQATYRNGNTIYFILNEVKAQTVSMAFDMGGLDVSNGSACSSGAVIPSRVLLGMGYTEDQAISAIRLSFGPFFTKEKAIELWPKIETILSRFIK